MNPTTAETATDLGCVFCSSEHFHLSSNGIAQDYVECQNCGATGPVCETAEESVAAWNTRPAITEAEQRGRTQALEEAAELLCGYCSQGNEVTLTASMEYDHFGAPYWPGWLHISTVGGKRFISQCGANLIRSAIESRTGEGE